LASLCRLSESVVLDGPDEQVWGQTHDAPRRVLRPGGHVLVGFQAGEGTRDVSAAYRRFGHDIRLERRLHTADQIAVQLEAAGPREVCRLVRRARGSERDDQAMLLAEAGS
jgi:hypothetical protein